MGRLFQPLLFLLARSTEHELRRQIEFLKAENEMLRKRVPKQRIFLSKCERERLIKLGNAIGPGAHVAKLLGSGGGEIVFAAVPNASRQIKGATAGFYGSVHDPTVLVERHTRRGMSYIAPGPNALSRFSDVTCRALEVHREPWAVRNAYGQNSFGSALLLARRLLEVGTRIVQVNWPASADVDP